LDQDAFRRTYRDFNANYCAYEKSILTNQCQCSQAERFCIAEREGVRCRSELGRERCLALLEILRDRARFALRTDTDRSVLPHGKAIRIQVGGLRGLLQALQPDARLASPIADVYGLIEAAQGKFGAIDSFPFAQIVQQVAAFRGRPRTKRR